MIVLKRQIPEHGITLAKRYVHSIRLQDIGAPALRWDPKILQLLAYLPAQRGELCDPQIVIHWPDRRHIMLSWHVDEPPPWASGRGYSVIFGIPLTTSEVQDDGSVKFSHQYVPPMELGDVVMFGPSELHSRGTNRTRLPRYAVYFRFLEIA